VLPSLPKFSVAIVDNGAVFGLKDTLRRPCLGKMMIGSCRRSEQLWSPVSFTAEAGYLLTILRCRDAPDRHRGTL